MERSAHGVQLSRSAHAHCTARRNARSAYMERSAHAPSASDRGVFSQLIVAYSA